jgi:hypothetical protein
VNATSLLFSFHDEFPFLLIHESITWKSYTLNTGGVELFFRLLIWGRNWVVILDGFVIDCLLFVLLFLLFGVFCIEIS